MVYQIYPRSFNDTDGDGVGDIPGIIENVGYLDSLGVDVVWLCPVYDSPNADNGYDIRDYRQIAEAFGDMADWEALLRELHAHDIRLIMDLVVNHTSDEHDWFQRSRRREGKYEDYYYWRDSTPENPPNNWESLFEGQAWSYDEVRGEWYLHVFSENQPDLNWRNPDVRADIKEMMTWWLEKGIDGFRMDAIPYLSKATGLPDGDPAQSPVGIEQYSHGPHIQDYFEELHRDVLSNYEIATVGEMGDTTLEQAAEYLANDNGLDMIFQLDHLEIDYGVNGRWDSNGLGEWDLRELKHVQTHKQTVVNDAGWDALFLGNHDLPRSVSRFGNDDEYRKESATLLATFLLTMRGTPYVYQGEELGMTNADFGSLDALDDPATIGPVEELLDGENVDTYEEVRGVVNYSSRDNSRTPMQWTSGENAGFTRGTPWLPVNENHTAINAETALANDDSVWHHYRTLIDLRHEQDVLIYGKYDLLLLDDDQIYAYTRTLADERALVVLNWSDEPAAFVDANIETTNATVLYGNYDDTPTDPAGCELRPYEALVYRLSQQ